MEGIGSNQDASASLSYEIKIDRNYMKLPLVRINYHSIAADDGKQPFWKKPMQVGTADGSTPRDTWKNAFPRLVDGEFSLLTAKPDESYNCWAWSCLRSDAWIGLPFDDYTDITSDVDVKKVNRRGVTYIDIGRMWGNHLGEWTVADFDIYYESAGVEPGQPLHDYKFIQTTSLDDAEILLYGNSTGVTHGARVHSPTQSGMGKWRMFESKCGPWELIEHTFDQLSGGNYGNVIKMYKRVPR